MTLARWMMPWRLTPPLPKRLPLIRLPLIRLPPTLRQMLHCPPHPSLTWRSTPSRTLRRLPLIRPRNPNPPRPR
jgi:hypothetical protein